MLKKTPLPAHLINYRVPFGPIGEPVFKRSYSHELDDGSFETWPEALIRAVDGNLGLVNPKFIEEGEREKLIELLLPFGILPGGRHLYASGIKDRQFVFNCHASGWDPQEPELHFTFLFDQLMQGGGVGANYSNRYLEKMPKIGTSIDLHLALDESHPNFNECTELVSSHKGDAAAHVFKVPDDREGWVKALEILVKTAFSSEGAKTIVLDASGIRKRGDRLKTSGGIACGPQPLLKMLANVGQVLNGCFGRQLTSLDAMDLDHAMADCVVAGGKRRSSRMSIKSWKDADILSFINCKKVDGLHWTTNISVEVDDEFQAAYAEHDDHARLVMKNIILLQRINGEPGVWNIDLARKGEKDPSKVYCPNPCGEINLYMWENCNVGHVNMEFFASKPLKQLKEAFRLMTRWLVRGTNADVPQPRQRAVLLENRRIGVGFFGFHAWIAMKGIKYSDCWKSEEVINTLGELRETVELEGTSYSINMGQPIPVKFTCLAPNGTGALLPGSQPSAQALMVKYGKRLVRYSTMDPQLAVKKSEGYETFQDTSAQGTETVVYWFEDPLVSKVRAAGFDPDVLLETQYDLSFETCLKVQAMLQDIWADNAISYTINILPEMMPSEEDMEATLMKYLPRLKGTTIFPEKSRHNNPIQRVTKAEWDAYKGQKEISMVEDECKHGCPVR